jgi:DNA-binding transcriptional LysR family regulator
MLEDISAFCAVVEQKSFSRAARQLGVSTAVITRRVARLEKSLDTRLLHRTTRLVSLTEPGQAFYTQVRDLLDALESSKKTVKSFTQEVTGTLKIGLPASISYLHLTPNLHHFTQKFPQLKIQIVLGNHLLDLLRESFDLIIYCSSLPDSNFHYQKLGDWRKIICASPDYLKKFAKPKTPEDLVEHQCLDHYDNFQRVWKFSKRNKLKSVTIHSEILANSSMDLKNLAVQGHGIAYLPSFTVYQELKSGQLISLLEDFQPPKIGMFAVYPSHQYMSKKSQLFLDFLKKLLAPVLAL